jgi:hypothetical protein
MCKVVVEALKKAIHPFQYDRQGRRGLPEFEPGTPVHDRSAHSEFTMEILVPRIRGIAGGVGKGFPCREPRLALAEEKPLRIDFFSQDSEFLVVRR